MGEAPSIALLNSNRGVSDDGLEHKTHTNRYRCGAADLIGRERRRNVAKVAKLVREAAGGGAQVILPPSCLKDPILRIEDDACFAMARPLDDDHPTLGCFESWRRSFRWVIQVSLFEKAGHASSNSLVTVDADGKVLGVYRKSHIPDRPGLTEKFYFRPGNSGFKAFKTRYGTIGAAVCWDQWFPEAARAMMLHGAELLLYPTAIGSEPHLPGLDTKDPWQRAMIGHAVSNVVPVIAANRIGTRRASPSTDHPSSPTSGATKWRSCRAPLKG